MSIQTNSSQSLENNSTWVTGPFLDLVESWEYEIKDAEFKIKVDEILATRKKVSLEQNQINRMMKIAWLKWKKEDLARILNNAVIKLKWWDKYEILAEEFLNMPESELSSFQTMLGEKIMSSHQDYQLPKGESAEYTDDSSQKLDFFDFDNVLNTPLDEEELGEDIRTDPVDLDLKDLSDINTWEFDDGLIRKNWKIVPQITRVKWWTVFID